LDICLHEDEDRIFILPTAVSSEHALPVSVFHIQIILPTAVSSLD